MHCLVCMGVHFHSYRVGKGEVVQCGDPRSGLFTRVTKLCSLMPDSAADEALPLYTQEQ